MPPGTAAPEVLLVAALASERWRSIDLYRDDLIRVLSGRPDIASVATLQANPDRDASWWRRQSDFYLRLPVLLRRTSRERSRPPVVHLLDQNYGHLCRFVVRTVVTCHDLAPLRIWGPSPRRNLYEARVRGMRHADAIVCVSKNTARDVSDLLGIDERRIHVNPLGVDPAFRPAPTRPGAGFTVLHVGNNDPRKNMPVLLRAFAKLRAKVPNARLVKVGPPLAASPYASLVASLGIADAVRDMGHVPLATLVSIYQQADILAFPSLYEGFGRPVIEAQACGTACVLARTSSLPEVGGEGALYHDAEDAERLAALLTALAENPEQRRRLGEAGIANAARFSWQAHADRLVEIYHEVA